MNPQSILSFISSRNCKRHFNSQAIDLTVVQEVLAAAAYAPSSKNTQSWEVAVLAGNSRDQLSEKLCKAFDEGLKPQPDYKNRPADPKPELTRREKSYGASVLAHNQIERSDEDAKREHRRRNYLFFDAPVELIFHLPQNAVPGNFLDLGFFMQNVMLGLQAHGLGSCPQFSVAAYSPIIHAHLGWEDPRVVVAGMALGYFEEDHPDNQFFPGRVPHEDFTQWYL